MHLQSSEGVSSLSAYTHHSVCSLWEHKSVIEFKTKQQQQHQHQQEDS